MFEQQLPRLGVRPECNTHGIGGQAFHGAEDGERVEDARGQDTAEIDEHAAQIEQHEVDRSALHPRQRNDRVGI